LVHLIPCGHGASLSLCRPETVQRGFLSKIAFTSLTGNNSARVTIQIWLLWRAHQPVWIDRWSGPSIQKGLYIQKNHVINIIISSKVCNWWRIGDWRDGFTGSAVVASALGLGENKGMWKAWKSLKYSLINLLFHSLIHYLHDIDMWPNSTKKRQILVSWSRHYQEHGKGKTMHPLQSKGHTLYAS
jgi:hypothetical protein